MSEHQVYEFVAVDKALTKQEMAELRAVSTRAEISSTRFWNEYHWGDLKADPKELLARRPSAARPAATPAQRHRRSRHPSRRALTCRRGCLARGPRDVGDEPRHGRTGESGQRGRGSWAGGAV